MGTRRVEAFLLRLVVQEDGKIAPDQWRGRIQHVATGKEQQIDQLQDAVAFISALMGEFEITVVGSEQGPSKPRC